MKYVETFEDFVKQVAPSQYVSAGYFLEGKVSNRYLLALLRISANLGQITSLCHTSISSRTELDSSQLAALLGELSLNAASLSYLNQFMHEALSTYMKSQLPAASFAPEEPNLAAVYYASRLQEKTSNLLNIYMLVEDKDQYVDQLLRPGTISVYLSCLCDSLRYMSRLTEAKSLEAVWFIHLAYHNYDNG